MHAYARVRVRAHVKELEAPYWDGFENYTAAPLNQSQAISKRTSVGRGGCRQLLLGFLLSFSLRFFLLVSFLLMRVPAPLLLLPEASLGGLPGFLFIAAAAASHSACATLSPATRSACAFAASPSAAFF